MVRLRSFLAAPGLVLGLLYGLTNPYPSPAQASEQSGDCRLDRVELRGDWGQEGEKK